MRLTKTAALLGAILALAACGKSSSSKTPNQLSVHGGKASAGVGGSAGGIYVYAQGGQITVKTDGGLPALPTWTYTAPALGANPLTIDADTAFTVGATVIGDDGVNPATGIWVKSGATVTLTPETEPTVSIIVPEGILIEGTVVMAPLAGTRNSSSLHIEAQNAAVRGSVRAVGADGATGESGGDGGAISGLVSNDVFITGSVLSTGGKGDTGGNGGEIDITVEGPTWAVDVTPSTIAVTGVVDSSGGEGLAGVGGAAGGAEVWGSWSYDGACNFFNSGAFRSRGGDGTTGGGDGAYLYASSCAVGSTVNKGTFDSSGGSATVDGPGGAAPADYALEIEAADGVMYAGGKLLAMGGKGAGTGQGGAGGDIHINADLMDVAAAPSLGVHVAARIDASGGEGATGGPGGIIEVYDDGAPTDAGITLHNYATLDCTGGAGTTAGGEGGDCEVYPYDRYDADLGGNVVGPLLNQAKVDASGGDASDGAGGGGGYVWVGTWIDNTGYTLLSPETVLTDSGGAILARGGKGTTTGGAGGQVEIYDEVALFSKATIDVSGGAGGTDVGGAGGGVHAYGPAAVTVTGKILASGGTSASADGGAAGGVACDAVTASLAAVAADGGAGATATGGNGGTVTLTSSTPASTLTGTISVRPGAGTTAGVEGTFTMDGTPMTLTEGRYSPP